jgi:hypothetical protein
LIAFQTFCPSEENTAGYLTFNMTDVESRVALWRGCLRLIEGLAHVHRFRAVHRALRSENIFLDSRRGPDSLRLGGFEWSVRLGDLMRAEPTGLSYVGRTNSSLNADWRDLGLVFASLFGVAQDIISGSEVELAAQAIQELPRLSDDEKAYLRHLVGSNGHGPLDSDDIVQGCVELIESFERPVRLRGGDHLGVVVALRNRLGPTDFAIWVTESDPEVNATDEAALRQLIEDDLADAEIISSGDADQRSFFLKGRKRPYRLFPFGRHLGDERAEPSWNLGHVSKAEYIDERRVAKRGFPMQRTVRVYTVQDANSSYAEICKIVRSWESILPPPAETPGPAQMQLLFLRRFLEVTNEIERAIRKTEIFPVHVVSKRSDANHEYVIMEESQRPERLPMADGTNPPMVAYLSDEDSKVPREIEIYVGPESDLEVDRYIEPGEFWTLDELPPGKTVRLAPNQVQLRRFSSARGKVLPSPPNTSFLRTRGMFAQLKLVDRREEGIELVATHTFLQRALVLPDTVYMDTGVEDLPLALPNEAKFDSAKRDALKQIWRTRPIYYLQGPPQESQFLFTKPSGKLACFACPAARR